MSEPATLSLAGARVQLNRGALSPQELEQSCRARIELWQPRINAFISTERRHADYAVPGSGHRSARAGRLGSVDHAARLGRPGRSRRARAARPGRLGEPRGGGRFAPRRPGRRTRRVDIGGGP